MVRSHSPLLSHGHPSHDDVSSSSSGSYHAIEAIQVSSIYTNSISNGDRFSFETSSNPRLSIPPSQYVTHIGANPPEVTSTRSPSVVTSLQTNNPRLLLSEQPRPYWDTNLVATGHSRGSSSKQEVLVRRGSSRRVVVNKAPSVRSERFRYSVISDEDDGNSTLHRGNNSIMSKQYGYYVPKKKLFRFESNQKKKTPIRYKYHSKQQLFELFEYTPTLHQNHLAHMAAREPLVLKQYQIPTLEKIKVHPALEYKLKVVSVKDTKEISYEDPTLELIDMYIHSTRPPTVKKEKSIKPSRSGTRRTRVLSTKTNRTSAKPTHTVDDTGNLVPIVSEDEAQYIQLRKQVFRKKTVQSKDIFKMVDVSEQHMKRLALSIYLRRLVAAKIALRMNLENDSISVTSSASLLVSDAISQPRNKTQDQVEFQQPRFNQNLANFGSLISLVSSTNFKKYDSLMNLSFASSAGSKITFHSFK